MSHRLTSFLVNRRRIILGVMLLMTVVGGLLMPHINVNTDMTKYLPTDSPMKEGLDKMQESFPGMTLNTSSVRAMYRDLDSLEQAHLADSIGGLPEVAMITSVQSKENYTLFDLSLSEGADPKQVAAGLRSSGREVMVETSIDGNLPDPIVFIIAGVLVFTILFLMCQSWIEPLLFLLCIGIAVIINIGSNALLPSVSMTTNAIVAILQLVLSMDYAIILTNRYRQEKEHNLPPVDAMKVALKNATPSVLSSAFTTIVGMLMLCFMKFRIGLDLGIVLAKGVFCSILCLYTVLPSLIIAFDRVIQKTNKRIFLPPTERLALFEHRFRIPLTIAAVVIFGVSYYLHTLTPIGFSTNWPTAITDIFPRKNAVVLLYDNKDEERILALADRLGSDAKIDTIVSYPTLLMRPYNTEEMAAQLQSFTPMMPKQAAAMMDEFLTPEMLEMVYQMMNEPLADVAEPDLTTMDSPHPSEVHPPAPELTEHHTDTTTQSIHDTRTQSDTLGTERSKDDGVAIDELATTKTTLEVSIRNPYLDTIHTPMTSSRLADYLGFKRKQAATLYKMAQRSEMSPYEFVHYVTSHILPNKLYSSFISRGQKQQLLALQRRMERAENEKASAPIMVEASAKDTAAHEITANEEPQIEEALMDATPPTPSDSTTDNVSPIVADEDKPMGGVSEMRNDKKTKPQYDNMPAPKEVATSAEKVSIAELLDFITHDLLNDPDLGALVPDSLKGELGNVQRMMDEGLGQIRGKGRSIAAIVTSYPDEGAEAQQFLKHLKKECASTLEEDYNLIGEMVMFEEMREGFGRELLVVTLLTIAAICLIVAITFHSIIIPLILILIVLSGVYINVFVSGLNGGTLLYLAYLIVQSILMGATIDYAILFSNYYREHRRTKDIAASLKEAYRGSIHTITTSGLIIVCAPGVMSLLVEDRTISMIVSCLAVGGAAAILLILFVLPGVLAALDKYVVRKSQGRDL